MSVKGDKRQEAQLKLYHSNQDVCIGPEESLPLDLDTLLSIEEGSPYLVKKINGGLTGIVYQIRVEGNLYNLKKERKEILVKNPDGQTSFMNEVQIRKRIHEYRQAPGYQGELDNIVRTLYASKQQGIILSPWIEAEHISSITPGMIRSLFTTYLELEKRGIFDLDPCSGNLLVQGEEVILFDFGYTYLFDPRHDYNPDGREFGLMHMAERFESRFFCQYLMDLEDSQGKDTALDLYREEKLIARDIYRQKLAWLEEQEADQEILDYVQAFISRWDQGLSSTEALKKMYSIETFLSYSMDARDDLHGQTCTPGTLKKIDRILLALETSFSELQSQGLFWGEEAGMDQAAMIHFWQKNRVKAQGWQVT